ncbi:VIT1/CCC1 transporter family protein [Aspergillus mulundensis]|uniref:Putative Vacuolar Fe2+ transporter n=1 Tax=Aspergillus mulundensis TaxID=1810919 RepID=A0A3D8SJE8_9EURO|nr:putative Vacuolar Fe2+ transporter [Aspergillus mulundensis]RDW86433.1 putative Vacuolar Fe2+ transporter [Aspergillus mulundensis]
MSFSSLSSLKGLLSPTTESEYDIEKDLSNSSDGESTNGEVKPRDVKNSKFIDGRVISDAIIGLSDGMTVPFALTAGLSALGDTKVVVFGGFAELIAGAISMGLGGYLGAKSEEYIFPDDFLESYHATLKETTKAALTAPSSVSETIHEIFTPYELPDHLVSQLTTHLTSSPHLPSFLMTFQHTLPEPSGSRAFTCALTIALSYFIGGFVPLLPYFFVGPDQAFLALKWSIATMAIALFLFGYGKTCFVSGWGGSKNIKKGAWGGLQMVIVGGVAAGCAMGLVKGFQALGAGSA